MAWEHSYAIYEKCRALGGGYRNLVRNTTDVNFVQPAQFLGGTLKFLYLTFSEHPELLPMDKWIFNSAAQPLPILDTQ